jgi:hypothetical protein
MAHIFMNHYFDCPAFLRSGWRMRTHLMSFFAKKTSFSYEHEENEEKRKKELFTITHFHKEKRFSLPKMGLECVLYVENLIY